MTLKTLFKSLIDNVLPHHCLLCNNISVIDKDICQTCWLSLPWLLSGCDQCAKPLDIAHTEPLRCGECLKQPPPYDTTISPLIYQDGVVGLITRLKFYNNLAVARLLGELMTQRVLAHYPTHELPTLLIPVPLHPKRLRRRGYNQASLIAQHISQLTLIPTQLNLCKRIRYTAPQSKTSFQFRSSNVVEAFMINDVCRDEHVAIIDDVMTTGATVGSLTQRLKLHGAKRVSIWCAARV